MAVAAAAALLLSAPAALAHGGDGDHRGDRDGVRAERSDFGGEHHPDGEGDHRDFHERDHDGVRARQFDDGDHDRRDFQKAAGNIAVAASASQACSVVVEFSGFAPVDHHAKIFVKRAKKDHEVIMRDAAFTESQTFGPIDLTSLFDHPVKRDPDHLHRAKVFAFVDGADGRTWGGGKVELAGCHAGETVTPEPATTPTTAAPEETTTTTAPEPTTTTTEPAELTPTAAPVVTPTGASAIAPETERAAATSAGSGATGGAVALGIGLLLLGASMGAVRLRSGRRDI